MKTTETADASSVDTRYSAERESDKPEFNGSTEPRSLRSVALTGLFVLAIFYTLKLASTFFVPLFLAVLLKFLFAPVIRGLARFHVPAPVGAVLVIAGLLSALGFGVYQIGAPARDWMAKLPQTVRQIEAKVRDLKRSVQSVSKASEEVDRLTTLGGPDKVQRVEVR
ncbi:MAG TPA: AI-2E family transporter, partial [Terriglobales bacterium]|nr:AI-2E family transporter [Terriglobales bacterium]